MEKVINSYETMFIVDLDAGEAGVKATVEKFTGLISSNGEIVEITEWGKRRLAYAINDKNEGYYVVVTFKAEGDFPAELDRNFRNDETIMREIIIRLEFEAVKHEKPMIAEEINFSESDEDEAPASKPTPKPVEAPEAVVIAEEAPVAEEVAEAAAAETPAEDNKAE